MKYQNAIESDVIRYEENIRRFKKLLKGCGGLSTFKYFLRKLAFKKQFVNQQITLYCNHLQYLSLITPSTHHLGTHYGHCMFHLLYLMCRCGLLMFFFFLRILEHICQQAEVWCGSGWHQEDIQGYNGEDQSCLGWGCCCSCRHPYFWKHNQENRWSRMRAQYCFHHLHLSFISWY